jgi:hypothetical protein
MVWVAEDVDIWQSAVQLDGHRPVWVVTIAAIVMCAEATVHSGYMAHTTIIYTLDRAKPEVYIGDHRIFDKYRDIHAS